MRRLPGRAEAMVELLLPAALWSSGKGESRLLFIARPSAEVRAAIEELLARHGILAMLGRQLFAPGNWHQSLSARYVDTPQVRELLALAGDGLRMQAFHIAFERLVTGQKEHGVFHWDIRPKAPGNELDEVVRALKVQISRQGLPLAKHGHAPHLTLSYGAGASLPSPLTIGPVPWTVDTIELVAGGGHPYRYTTLREWALEPASPPPSQSSLF